jgi:Tfp pilus assembly protein PilF
MVITMIGVNDDGHKLKRKNRNIIVSMLDKTRTFNFLFGLYQNLVDKKLLKMSNLKNMKLKNSENSELKRKELKNVKLKNKENMPQNNYDALFEAACLYLENKEFNKALGLLYDCTKMEPENSQAWYELGCYFKEIEKNQARAEHCWLKAVKGDPEDENSFCELGNLYWDQNKTDLAEKFWKRALALDPANEASLNNLGKLLIETKRFEEARNYYFGALKKDPHLYIAHAGLARAAGLSKDAAGMSKDAAALHLKNAEQSRVKYYSPETAYNYRKIIAKIKNRGIIPVVMQYPLRSLVPLKSMLNNDPDLLFVSNEKSFKQAVLNGQEQDYFTDLFAGDFGHCTFKGHKMIAENAGKAILQRYF